QGLRRLDLLELALDRLVRGAGATGACPRGLAVTGGAAGTARTGPAAAIRAVRAVAAGLARALHRPGGLVGSRGDSRQGPGERVHPGFDRVVIRALERLAQRVNLARDLGLVIGRHLVPEVGDRALGLVRELLGLVPQLDVVATLLVLG